MLNSNKTESDSVYYIYLLFIPIYLYYNLFFSECFEIYNSVHCSVKSYIEYNFLNFSLSIMFFIEMPFQKKRFTISFNNILSF